jgi:hypothetical protein
MGFFALLTIIDNRLPMNHIKRKNIVIKPSLGVDPGKEPGLGFHGSTRINSGQPGKIKKIKVLIFHMKKSM